MGIMKKAGGLGKRLVTSPFRMAKGLVGVDQARENWRWITSLAGALRPGDPNGARVETFEHAMRRQGATEKDLEKIYTNHVLRFWICSLLLLVGVGVVVSYVFSGHALALFPGVGFVAICLSQMFSASFRARQLARRRFCDVSEWLADSSSWVPLSFNLPPAPKGRKPAPKPLDKGGV
jgi:hypothetical protein